MKKNWLFFRCFCKALGYFNSTIRVYSHDTRLFLFYLTKQDIAAFLRKQHLNAAKSSRN